MDSIQNKVFVINTQEKGRCLIADCTFGTDDAVLTETPLASSQFLWNELYGYAACGHCLCSLEPTGDLCRRLLEIRSFELVRPELCPRYGKPAPVKCNDCEAIYCCEECRDLAAITYHRTLCLSDSNIRTSGLLELKEVWRNMHYPPETASIMIMARIMATVIQSEDPQEKFNSFQKFCHISQNDQANIAHKFLGDQYVDNIEILRKSMSDIFNNEYTFQWFTNEGFASLFALVATNGQGIGTSSLSEWVKNCNELVLSKQEDAKLNNYIDRLYVDLDNVAGQFLNSEGSGLYGLQSAANHSCTPNAESTFPHNDFTVVLKALKPIEKGEEICISYLSECQLESSRHSRTKFLRLNYLFNCTCEKCKEQINDEDVTSDEEEVDEDEDGMDLEEQAGCSTSQECDLVMQ